MSLIQLAALMGALLGAGCVALVWQLLPAEPDLGGALDRLSPDRALARPVRRLAATEEISRSGRVGLWIMRHAPWLMLGKTSTVDLELLQIPVHRFYAQKVEYSLLGMGFPVFTNTLLWLLGSQASLVLTFGGSLLLAAVFSLVPNFTVSSQAAHARKTFQWALIAYIELVAVERHAGSGARPALERAASMSDSWVFRLLGEELARSRWAGESPWEGMTRLGRDLRLNSLVDFSEVMRLAGEEGANIYEILRGRAASMRSEIVNGDLGDAAAKTQRMALPIGGLFLVFGAMLIAPVLLRAVHL